MPYWDLGSIVEPFFSAFSTLGNMKNTIFYGALIYLENWTKAQTLCQPVSIFGSLEKY
jgi:hypothetical protein